MCGPSVGSGGSEYKNEPAPPSPIKALWALNSIKGHEVSQVVAPLGMPQNCHKAYKQEAFTGLCVWSCRDMSKDHSTPWLLTPLPNKKDQIKNPYI
jgi:hypothetical protein